MWWHQEKTILFHLFAYFCHLSLRQRSISIYLSRSYFAHTRARALTDWILNWESQTKKIDSADMRRARDTPLDSILTQRFHLHVFHFHFAKSIQWKSRPSEILKRRAHVSNIDTATATATAAAGDMRNFYYYFFFFVPIHDGGGGSGPTWNKFAKQVLYRDCFHSFLLGFSFRSIIIFTQPSIESLLACIDASAQSFRFVGRQGKQKGIWSMFGGALAAKQCEWKTEIEQKNFGVHEKSDVKHMEISCANPSDMFNSIKTKSGVTSSPAVANGNGAIHNILNECIWIHRFWNLLRFDAQCRTRVTTTISYLALRRMPPRQRNLSRLPLSFFRFISLYERSLAVLNKRQRPPSNGINGMQSAFSIRHHDKLSNEMKKKEKNNRKTSKEEMIVASMQMWF